jgi:hypothetical protein
LYVEVCISKDINFPNFIKIFEESVIRLRFKKDSERITKIREIYRRLETSFLKPSTLRRDWLNYIFKWLSATWQTPPDDVAISSVGYAPHSKKKGS